jgi:hypothetical protein
MHSSIGKTAIFDLGSFHFHCSSRSERGRAPNVKNQGASGDLYENKQGVEIRRAQARTTFLHDRAHDSELPQV